MKKILFMYYRYKIKILEKQINQCELMIYFDRFTGIDCIDFCNYCNKKINDLKLKIKNYE